MIKKYFICLMFNVKSVMKIILCEIVVRFTSTVHSTIQRIEIMKNDQTIHSKTYLNYSRMRYKCGT